MFSRFIHIIACVRTLFLFMAELYTYGLPRPGFDPWVSKMPWRRKWQPTSVFLPGESHGQRSLVGYNPWGHKELDTTDRLTLWLYTHTHTHIFHSSGFPSSSVGKESACNSEDPSSIPGLGRSSGEGIGYSLLYSWASLVAQLVKNPPTMWETWVWSLGWEDTLEKGKATYSSILAWRIPWTV